MDPDRTRHRLPPVGRGIKKLTIKLKITLWFTIFMIILSAVILPLSLSSSTSVHELG